MGAGGLEKSLAGKASSWSLCVTLGFRSSWDILSLPLGEGRGVGAGQEMPGSRVLGRGSVHAGTDRGWPWCTQNPKRGVLESPHKRSLSGSSPEFCKAERLLFGVGKGMWGNLFAFRCPF